MDNYSRVLVCPLDCNASNHIECEQPSRLFGDSFQGSSLGGQVCFYFGGPVRALESRLSSQAWCFSLMLLGLRAELRAASQPFCVSSVLT